MITRTFILLISLFCFRPPAVSGGTEPFLAPYLALFIKGSGGCLLPDSVINPADTMLLWDVDTIDFGTLKAGETLSVQYGFYNASREVLEIELVSACNCMELNWTTSPILPGQRGFIEVLYNSKDLSGRQKKDIDVILRNTDARGYPLVRRATLTGFVE